MSINAATGALTRGPTTTINFATGASCVAIHPDGSHLYVAASGAPAGFIQVFSVDGAGALTATSQVPAGHGRICIAVDAGGEFMYVTNSSDNAVSTYSISQGGGALTLLEQDPTGTFPQAIALTP
jgi:6-phosphogluconolactonase (cycloisomerase 2 family)